MRRAYYSRKPRRASQRGSGRGTAGVGNVLKYFPRNNMWFPAIFYNYMTIEFPVQIRIPTVTADDIVSVFTLNTNNLNLLLSTADGEVNVQPQGFDQMTNDFNRWQVMDCRVTLTCTQNAGAGGFGVEGSPVTVAATWLDNDADAPSTPQGMYAGRFTRHVVVMPYGGGQRPKVMNLYAKTSSVLNLPISQQKATMSEGGAVSPTLLSHLDVSCFINDASDTALGMYILVKMKMLTKWSLPTKFNSSSGVNGTVVISAEN